MWNLICCLQHCSKPCRNSNTVNHQAGWTCQRPPTHPYVLNKTLTYDKPTHFFTFEANYLPKINSRAYIFSGNGWMIWPHQISSLRWGLLMAGQTKDWDVTRTEYRGAWSIQPATSPWGLPQTDTTFSLPKAAGTDCTSQAKNNPIHI